jgi:glycosyltransferase involved in cell wall biosynthesis
MRAKNGSESLENKPDTIFLGTDLPYFPGKMGVDFFNLRYLAQTHRVTVVGPRHERLPTEGVANLEKTAYACYLWPRRIAKAPVTTEPVEERTLLFAFRLLPRELLRKVLSRLIAVDRRPPDAFHHIEVLSNLAPYLIAALREQKPTTIVLLQSSTEPWLQFLPPFVAKFVYFHDVRADIEEKRQKFRRALWHQQPISRAKRQERLLLNLVEGAAFVSQRDLDIAKKLYSPRAQLFTAPIPIDTQYFSLSTPPQPDTEQKSVLFTGHLGHPPNVDAISYFLEQIWPRILERIPSAEFVVAGCFPDPKVSDLLISARNASLHRDVPDIRPFFERASVYVVPMRFGGGVRQKILEAWSMKRPVVATSMAVEGLDVQHGVQLWLEDTPETFATRVAEILEGQLDIQAMTERNRSFVQERYSVSITSARFAQAVNTTRSLIKERPFRILFDLRWMQLGYSDEIDQLVHESISAISELDARNEYRFYGPRSKLLDWSFPKTFKRKVFFSDASSQRMRNFSFDATDALALVSGSRPFMTREMRFLRFLNKLDFDLVHSFQGFSHPEFDRFPAIVTIPDLQHLISPQLFSKEDYKLRERLFRSSVENASHIICLSNFTLEAAHHFYAAPRAKMSVVWNMPGQLWRIPIQAAERNRIFSKLGIQAPFVLFPAPNWPHKNHQRLLIAFDQARQYLAKDIKLVLTGATAKDGVDLPGIISRLNLESSVVHLGPVTTIQLRALYDSALALVFPSLFEGSGMPVAEAILSGCPVACSATTSLPEIAGNAALLFDPLNTEEISAALVKICTDHQVRDHLQKEGLIRQSRFSSWNPAIQTISIYHKVVQERFS